jgi:mRNA interferase MazF
MKQGDIILAQFPFFDEHTSKVRPSLILSSDEFNEHFPELIVCSITSKKPTDTFHIPLTNTSLRTVSYIRVQNITKVHKSRIHKTIGSVSPQIVQQTKQMLFKLLTN